MRAMPSQTLLLLLPLARKAHIKSLFTLAVGEVEMHSISVLVTSSHVHEPSKLLGPHATIAADARLTLCKHDTSSSKQTQAPATRRVEECILQNLACTLLCGQGCKYGCGVVCR